MSKRSVFTTVTPLDPGISRETVLETLHDHVEMIDLNPLVIERHPIKPPSTASPEEYHCQWYQLTDRVQYLPGGLAQGKVSYNVCFHDLSTGLQTHCLAPAGLDIRAGEPIEAPELGLGVPKNGLWLREDVDMRCNILMLGFVKKTLKKAHSTLVARLVEKAHLLEAQAHNDRLSVFNSRRDSTMTGNSLRPGYQSGVHSDNSSLRSSRVPQSPRIPHQFQTPLASPSYQTMDPTYRDTREPHQYLTEEKAAQKLHIQPDATYALELPAEMPSHSTQPSNPASTVHHELPARLFD